MGRLRREVNIFNLSFLDVLSCGLGAVVVLFLVGFHGARHFESRERDRKRLEDALAETRKGFAEKQKVTRELQALIDGLRAEQGSSEEEIRSLQRQLDRLQWINFVGIRTEKKSLLIVMDLSASMYGKDDNYVRAADKLVQVAQALVQAIPGESYRLNVMGFRGAAPSHELPTFEPGRVFLPATASVRERAQDAIRSIVARYEGQSGGTPTWEALEEAFRYPGLGAVILITDGAPNGCNEVKDGVTRPLKAKLDEFLDAARALVPADVELHCIGLGKELYGAPAFRHFLVRLAQQNRGGFAAF